MAMKKEWIEDVLKHIKVFYWTNLVRDCEMNKLQRKAAITILCVEDEMCDF